MATVNERNTRRRRKRGKKNAESGEYRLQIVLLYFLFHLDPSIGMIPSVLVVRGLSVIWYHSFHVLRTYRPFFCIIRIMPKLSGLGIACHWILSCHLYFPGRSPSRFAGDLSLSGNDDDEDYDDYCLFHVSGFGVLLFVYTSISYFILHPATTYSIRSILSRTTIILHL